MIQERDDIVALDSAIIQHPRTWEASGHLAGFTDPLVECLASASSASGPTTSTSPECPEASSPGRGVRPHRAARVQPHVRDDDRAGEGVRLDASTCARDRRRASSSTSRTCSSSRAASRRSGSPRSASRSATRSRPATSSSARASSSRWRWSSSSRPTEAQQWYEHWMEERRRWYERPRHPARPPAPPRARRRRALPLLDGHRRHRVPVPDRLARARGHRQPRRLRPHPARRVLRQEARVHRPADRRALRPARDRAGGRRRPGVLAFLCDAYDEDEVGGEQRTVLKAPPGDRADQGRRAAAAAQGRPARDGARRSTTLKRGCCSRVRRRAARSAGATGARTRSARRSASPSTTRRSRTARSRSATATPSPGRGSRSTICRRAAGAAERGLAARPSSG